MSLSAVVVRGEIFVVGGRFETVRVVVRRYLSVLTGGVRVRAVRVGRNCRGIRLERNAVKRSVVCGRSEVRCVGAKESGVFELVEVRRGEGGEEEGNEEGEDKESDIEISCVPPAVGAVGDDFGRRC